MALSFRLFYIGGHLTNDRDIPAVLWSKDGYSSIAVPGAKENGYSYGLYTNPWFPVSVGDTNGGGPPFRYAVEACAAAAWEVCIPTGILGARIMGAPAGVGDLSWGIAVIPANGDVINLAASAKITLKFM